MDSISVVLFVGAQNSFLYYSPAIQQPDTLEGFSQKMTVGSLTVPIPESSPEPLVIPEAPLIAAGMMNRGFLSHVTLEWVGPGASYYLPIEHWVKVRTLSHGCICLSFFPHSLAL